MKKENNSNSKKVLSNITSIASILCYIASIVIILNGNTTNGIVWLCIGTAMLSSSTIFRRQETKNEKESNDMEQS